MKNRFLNLLAKTGLNGFFFLLLGMILLAYLLPEPGTRNSKMPVHWIAEYGVSVIFFFYGLRLSPEKLRAGLANWRLHLTVHTSTFILFPLIVILAGSLGSFSSGNLLWLGVFYLAALPSTVSSSVVLVSIAGGNVPAAIFNASISSILGIFITPAWMGLFIRQASGSFDLGPVILKLALEILFPVLLGLWLHRRLGTLAEKYRKFLRQLDQFIILVIVYSAFCESFAGRMFESFPISRIILLGVAMLAFFFLMFFLMHLLARFFGFSKEDRITLLFCGSKKSLVQGAVMGRVLFPDPVMLGVVLLPLMMYHALQLLSGSAIAQGMGKDA